jgi:hypothetical protein
MSETVVFIGKDMVVVICGGFKAVVSPYGCGGAPGA